MNTNTEREELARIATGVFYESRSSLHAMTSVLRLAWFRVADAIFATGYRKPRTITTVEELDALPDESVIRDSDPAVCEKEYGRWYVPRLTGHFSATEITLPATVLYVPEPTK